MKYPTCTQQGMSGYEDRALLAGAVVSCNGHYAFGLADLTDADPTRCSSSIRCRG